MIIKMTKRRGAKFKRRPFGATCCINLSDSSYMGAESAAPRTNHREQILVDCLIDCLKWRRVPNFVIFIFKCLILFLCIHLIRNPHHQGGSILMITSAQSATQQQQVEKANDNRNQSIELKLLAATAPTGGHLLDEASWGDAGTPQDRYMRDTDDPIGASREDTRFKSAARTSKHLKELLARPRHILSSFVPHTLLTKQLVIKRPNNLMKLKRFQTNLHTNSAQNSKHNLSKNLDANTRQQLFVAPVIEKQNPIIHPIHMPQQQQQPNFRLQLDTLQVRPLILTPPIMLSPQNELHVRPIALINKLQQHQQQAPPHSFVIKTDPSEFGVGDDTVDNNKGHNNMERDLDHFDRLIKSEYENRMNINERLVGHDNGDELVDGRNGSSIGFRLRVPNSQRESSTGGAQLTSVEPENTYEEPSSWLAEGRQVAEESFLMPAAPPWRPTEHSSSKMIAPAERQAKRFKQQAEQNSTDHSGARIQFRTLAARDFTSALRLDNDDDLIGSSSGYGKQWHSMRNHHDLPLSSRLSGTIGNQLAPSQQSFVPTALETIAQLRLNTHNNNTFSNGNHAGEPLTNGTKSYLQPLTPPQTAYQKVPTLVQQHKANKPSSSLVNFLPSSSLNPTRRQQNLQQQVATVEFAHSNFPRAHHSEGLEDGNLPKSSLDGVYLMPPPPPPPPPSLLHQNPQLLLQHYEKVRGKGLYNHHNSRQQNDKPPDSMGQIISSMTALSPPTSNNSMDRDGSFHNYLRRNYAPNNHGVTGGGSSGISEVVNSEDDGDDGHSVALSETLRRLRETKARIRQLQAELNATDPNLLLLRGARVEETSPSVIENEDIGDEGKYDDDELDNSNYTNSSQGDSFSRMSSSSGVTNSHQRSDWFRGLWPGNGSSSSNGGLDNNDKQFANRSLLLMKDTNVVRAHESMNLPLGMYHTGPLTAPARLVASAFGRAAKSSAPTPIPPGGSYGSMLRRPHLARVHGSAPVLVSSYMIVRNGDPIELHTTRPPFIHSDTTMASPELANNNNSKLPDLNALEEATIGQRLGSHFGPISSSSSKSSESNLASSVHHTAAHKGPFLTQAGVAAAAATTTLVGSHNSLSNPMDTMNPTSTNGASSSSSSESLDNSNNRNSYGNGNDRLVLDANQVPKITTRFTNHQLSSTDLLLANTTGFEMDHNRPQNKLQWLNGGAEPGGQRQLLERKPNLQQQANGSVAIISSSVSSRIAGGGRNFEAKAQQLDNNKSGFNGMMKHHQRQFSDSFDQDTVNSINQLLGAKTATSTGAGGNLSTGQLETGKENSDTKRSSDTATKNSSSNNSSSGNSISQLFSKLFQSLTFSSPANHQHHEPNGRQSAQQQHNSSVTPTATMATNPATTVVESGKLTTEKVLHTLMAFSCSLALLCLFVVVATVRCQMRARKGSGGSSRAALSSANSSRSGARSLSGLSPLDWRRGLGIGGANSGQQALNKGDRLILDGTMRNVSMMAKHLCTTTTTSGAKNLKDQRKPSKLTPLPLLKRTCCHCVGCSESWLFRDSSCDQKNKTHTCSSGFYYPAPPRGKLPFGAASSVNKFLKHQHQQQVKPGDNLLSEQKQTTYHCAAGPALGSPNLVASLDAAELLKSPGARGPIGGTRLRMMSAIEERSSPEPGLGLGECACGQCQLQMTLSNNKASLINASTRQQEVRVRAGTTKKLDQHCECDSLLEAAGDLRCNCSGGSDSNKTTTSQLAKHRDIDCTHSDEVSLERIKMSLDDDGLIGPSMDVNCRELHSINELTTQQQQHQAATTSAKTSASTITNTNANATLANFESIAGGTSGVHCCKLRAKHGPNVGNGCCKAVEAANTDARTTSAKVVLSPMNVKLQTSNNLRGGDLSTAADGCELVSSDQGFNEEEEATNADAKQQQQQLDGQKVRARVREFNNDSQQLEQEAAKIVGLRGVQELGDDAATCCPHDTSKAAGLLNRNRRLREERSTRRATTRLAAFASSPLSLAATIHGKLRKTMAIGATTTTHAATATNSAFSSSSANLQSEQILCQGSIIGTATNLPAQNVSNRAKQRPMNATQELRIEVEPARFNSYRLMVGKKGFKSKPKQPG